MRVLLPLLTLLLLLDIVPSAAAHQTTDRPAPPSDSVTRLHLPWTAQPPLQGWTLVSGQVIRDGQQIQVQGGSTLAYTDFPFDQFTVELEYCVPQRSAAQPVIRLRNRLGADAQHLQGTAVHLPYGGR